MGSSTKLAGIFAALVLLQAAAPGSAMGRRHLSQTYTSEGDWGSSTTTVDPKTGLSETTTTVDNPYYKGTYTTKKNADGTYTSTGGGQAQGRKLAETYGSSGDWGSTSTTVDPQTGLSETTTNVDNPYYKGSYTTTKNADGTYTSTGGGQTQGRKLSQTYESSGDWGSTSTTVDPDTGLSTTTTTIDNPYYKGTYTTKQNADGTYTSTGGGQAQSQGRKLAETYGSSGDWGSTTTTVDPQTGLSETTTNVDNPYYKGSYNTEKNADGTYTSTGGGQTQGRKLAQTYESSGDWGSTSTTVDPDTGLSTTTTTIDNPYYKGTYTTKQNADGTYTSTGGGQAQGQSQGRKLAETYGSSGDWGSTTTTVDPDTGLSTTTTTIDNPYYKGTYTTKQNADGTYTSTGGGQAQGQSQGRKLAETYGSSGDWGSTTTTVDPQTGLSETTTKVDNPYYKGTYTTKKNADGTYTSTGGGQPQGRKLSATYESSGDWGSTTTTTDPNTGASETTTNVDNPYYKGSYTTKTGPDGTTTTGGGSTQGRKLKATYTSSGDWGSSTTTTDPNTGSSETTTNVDNPYYKGSYTTKTGPDGTTTTGGGATQGRRRLFGTWGSSGSWGSSYTTTTPGSSTTTVNNPWYQGSWTTNWGNGGSSTTGGGSTTGSGGGSTTTTTTSGGASPSPPPPPGSTTTTTTNVQSAPSTPSTPQVNVQPVTQAAANIVSSVLGTTLNVGRK